MNQVPLLRIEGYNIKFAFVSPAITPANVDIAPDKIAVELIPFGNKLF